MKIMTAIPVKERPADCDPGVNYVVDGDSMAQKGNIAIRDFLANPDGEWLCFRHLDTTIVSPEWVVESRLAELDRKVAVAGVIGSLALDGAIGWWLNNRHINGVGAIRQGNGNGGDYWMTDWPVRAYSGAAQVDGNTMWLRRDALEAGLRFCELIPGYDHYDNLICAQALSLGYKVGVVGVEVLHQSQGTPRQGWSRWLPQVRKIIGAATGNRWPVVSGVTKFESPVYPTGDIKDQEYVDES